MHERACVDGCRPSRIIAVPIYWKRPPPGTPPGVPRVDGSMRLMARLQADARRRKCNTEECNGSQSDPEAGSRCRTGRGRGFRALAGRRGVRGVDGRPADRHAQEGAPGRRVLRSEEHTSELQSLMRISYAVLCLKK